MNKLLIAALAGFALPSPAFARPMTATDLATLRRIGTTTLSPDGHWLAWQLRETDLAANKGRTDLWLLDLTKKGAAPARIASTPDHNEHEPSFSADSRTLFYLSDASGSEQLWRVGLAGAAPEQVTKLPVDVGGYLLSPKGDRVALWADRSTDCADLACASAAAKPAGGSGRTYDQLFVRHWDTWATQGERSRLYVMPLAGGAAVSVVGPLVGDTPSKPDGGSDQIAWSADGQTLFFALREAGRIESLSTNLDLFAAPADGTGGPVNLTAANKATDNLPSVSPDGKWLAYAAMARPGYEADRMALHLRDLTSGEVRTLAPDWDVSIDSIGWSADGRSLLVTAGESLDEPLYRVAVADGKVTRLTKGGHVSGVLPTRDGGAIIALDSITAPADLYRVSARGKLSRLTSVNADKLAEIDVPRAERFTFAGAAGDKVMGWVVTPKGASAKLPTTLLVHGGPQGSFSDSWSYRWNPMLFAAPGHAVVSIDFHGSTGHGQAFTDSIRNDWGGKPLEDLKLGLAAAAARYPAVDPANACAAGGSYGGYMMNWIAGNWPDQFKCLIVHAGVFDARAMAYETEELWFDEWEHGGKAYYEDPAAFEKWNPVNHVAAWKTPMLVIAGEKDFRIPYTQSLGVFTAAQRRDIPSRLVVYPDENHWVLKPKNSIQWYGEVFAWMDRWTGTGAK